MLYYCLDLPHPTPLCCISVHRRGGALTITYYTVNFFQLANI